jgi:prepilin-type N-terminal cleavage/methylation domain-containing protein
MARGSEGFSLLETAVALALLGLVLLYGLALLGLEVGAGRRIAAHRQALQTLETALENVRAGTAAVPPDCAGQPAGQAGLEVCAEVEPLLPPGLYRLVLRARYAVGSQPFTRELETLLWRP